VGGNAQIKSMKKVAGTLKLDQAQYPRIGSFLQNLALTLMLQQNLQLNVEEGTRKF
jgi:F0F1-type ATP synthase alpha subunit